jgi:hypothetical protein
MGDLARITTDTTWKDTHHHLPVYKAVPSTMLEEEIFEFADQN